MPIDKPAIYRHKIGKPCIGGTQLQELHCEQTVRLSSALLCGEMQMSSLPNERQAQLWVAWWRQVCGPWWLRRGSRIRVLWYKQRIWESGKILRYYQFEDNLSYKDGLSSLNRSIKGVNTDSYVAPFQLPFQIQWRGSEKNIVSGSVSLSFTTTQSLFLRIEQRTIAMKCIQKIRKKSGKGKKGKGGVPE